MARRMRHVCFAMSLQCEWRINHVFPLSITEVIDHKLSLLFSGTHGSTHVGSPYGTHMGSPYGTHMGSPCGYHA